MNDNTLGLFLHLGAVIKLDKNLNIPLLISELFISTKNFNIILTIPCKLSRHKNYSSLNYTTNFKIFTYPLIKSGS